MRGKTKTTGITENSLIDAVKRQAAINLLDRFCLPRLGALPLVNLPVQGERRVDPVDHAAADPVINHQVGVDLDVLALAFQDGVRVRQIHVAQGEEIKTPGADGYLFAERLTSGFGEDDGVLSGDVNFIVHYLYPDKRSRVRW